MCNTRSSPPSITGRIGHQQLVMGVDKYGHFITVGPLERLLGTIFPPRLEDECTLILYIYIYITYLYLA